MATKSKFIRYNVRKNSLPTAKEPYMPVIVSNGTLTLDDICEKIAADFPELDATRARYVIDSVAEEISSYLADGWRVNINNWLAVYPAISGSVASVDAPLTAENAIYGNVVTIRASDSFENVIPTPLKTAEETDAPHIDAVEDVATHTKGMIVGKTKFVITGKRLFCGASGEQVCLKAPHGSVVLCETIDNDQSGTGERIYARVAEDQSGYDAGTYTLCVKTFGGATVGGKLVEVTKSVFVAAV